MTQVRKIFDNEIAAAVSLYVWQQLKTPLGLVSCNVGSQFDLAGPNPLATYLPAVRVSILPATGVKDLPRRVWIGTYQFEIHYLRVMSRGIPNVADEDCDAVTRPATSQIGSLFIQDPDFKLPTFSQPGCKIHFCWTHSVEADEDKPEQAIDVGLGHGIVGITVEAESPLYAHA